MITQKNSMKWSSAHLAMNIATVRSRIEQRQALDSRDIDVLDRAAIRLCQWPADVDTAAISDADLYQTQRAEDNGVIDFADARVLFALGLAGETGEVVDYLKKVIGHGKELDREKLTDELGDVLWYLSQLAHIHGITLSEIMRHNTGKIQVRYPHGFQGNLPHWSERHPVQEAV